MKLMISPVSFKSGGYVPQKIQKAAPRIIKDVNVKTPFKTVTDFYKEAVSNVVPAQNKAGEKIDFVEF